MDYGNSELLNESEINWGQKIMYTFAIWPIIIWPHFSMYLVTTYRLRSHILHNLFESKSSIIRHIPILISSKMTKWRGSHRFCICNQAIKCAYFDICFILLKYSCFYIQEGLKNCNFPLGRGGDRSVLVKEGFKNLYFFHSLFFSN